MITEAVYLHYLSSLLEGNKKQCIQIVTGLIDSGTGLKEIYLKLFQRSMYRIGQMWENKRCKISDEHIATKITETLIELVSTHFSQCKNCDRTAIITCLDKEFHELGAKMVAGFFEAHSWNVIFTGSNIPQEEVLNVMRERKPNVIGISNSCSINIARLVKLVEAIKAEFPGQEIIVGGQAISEDRGRELFCLKNVKYISSLDSLEEYISAYTTGNLSD